MGNARPLANGRLPGRQTLARSGKPSFRPEAIRTFYADFSPTFQVVPIEILHPLIIHPLANPDDVRLG